MEIGQRIDVLEVQKILGQGAFGITYLVQDTYLLQPKVLKEYFPSSWAARRNGTEVAAKSGKEEQFDRGLSSFLDEGRRLAKLDHPNIVKVERCFPSNGTAYLLMPYYEGKTLAEMLERGGVFNFQESMYLVRPLLAALVYLEEREIVHCDIKPANIYVTNSSEPKLLDFGAAQGGLAREEGGGQLFGSGGYAAIEQLNRNYEIGPWTDIYGMAATLYRLITGQIPDPATARLKAVEAGKPDSLMPLEKLVGREYDSFMLDAVGQGLALFPENRPSSARDWRESFDFPESELESLSGEDERDPVGRWITLIIILSLLAGFSYFLLLSDNPPQLSGPVDTSEPEMSAELVERAWKRAITLDSIEGYIEFINEYPANSHTPSAEARLADLEDALYQEASSADSVDLLIKYVEQFPDGSYIIEAKTKLEVLERAEAENEMRRQEQIARDDEAWEKARKTKTLAAIDEYLTAYPDGVHYEEANSLRQNRVHAQQDRAAFESASKVNRKASYQAYLNKWPKGQYVLEALSRIEDLTLRPGRVFKDCGACPEMVVVKGGGYTQGASQGDSDAARSERPSRQVRIANPIAVGVYEVTFQQWDACVAEGKCRKVLDDGGWGRGLRPVINVSWQDAQTYVDWLSQKSGYAYRLLSESEWEYVARAGAKGAWPGDKLEEICRLGNGAAADSAMPQAYAFCKDGVPFGTAPVGSYAKNAFGVHDTAGNVSEWVQDCMNLSYFDAPVDGSAWEKGLCRKRVTRGGSWLTGLRDMRLSSRLNMDAGKGNDFTGFRVARGTEEP